MSESELSGGCACGAVRYRAMGAPLIVNCCHCASCQTETGTAFALNALYEADRVELIEGAPEPVATPSESGRGQTIWRCPACRVALWSNYGGAGDRIRFIRVGTLDEPALLPPDVHIYTRSKLPWVRLPEGAQAFEGYYDSKQVWPAESLERLSAIFR